MKDYYELLAIDPSWSPTEIDKHLLALNRKYRNRANHRDGMIREEAATSLGWSIRPCPDWPRGRPGSI